MDLSPERRLLLACARATLSANDRARIAELANADLDWKQLAAVSYAQGIAPLIYHSLLESDATGLISPAAAHALRNSYAASAARSLLLYSDLRKILQALREEKIEVIVLKGAALAETVYPHKVLRPMSDIDLLVRRERLREVEAKLIEMGYMLDESTKEYWQEHEYHLIFESRGGAAVEIHWHIQRPTDPFTIDLEALWERAQPLRIAGVEAFVFSPNDLVLYLCQHLWKHELMGGIRPLCDIAESVRTYGDQIDWTTLTKTSSEWGMNSCSYLVLYLARELLDAAVPDDFLRRVKPVHIDNEIIGCARGAVLGHGECPLLFPDLLKLFWKGASVKERWSIIQHVLSGRTGAAYANNRSGLNSASVYYPLRIGHLLTQYGSTVIRLWAGDRRLRAAAGTEEKRQRLNKWLNQSSLQVPTTTEKESG